MQEIAFKNGSNESECQTVSKSGHYRNGVIRAASNATPFIYSGRSIYGSFRFFIGGLWIKKI